MTYWESKTRVFAIDGLTVVSCIDKRNLNFVFVEYNVIDWTALEEIRKSEFEIFRTKAIELANEINQKFNQ